MFKLTKINRRFLPLYAGAFLQGLVFWYAIEKLFMRNIGYDDAQIGYVIAFMMLSILLLEIPSGILSDRWSRKGTLAIGFFGLALSGAIGSVSQNVWHYVLAVLPWGLYEAMVSGVYESVVYDTLEEEDESSNQYEKYFGRIDIFASVGLIAGSLLSTPIAEFWGQRAAYIATVPAALLAAFITLRFREPKIHKQNQRSELLLHIRQTFREVLRQPQLYWLLAAIFTTAVTVSLLFEFVQLWWIPLGLSVALFGPFNAMIMSTIGIAGAVAQSFKTRKRVLLLSSIAIVASILLIVDSIPIIIAAQFTLLTSLLILDLLLNKQLQDSLSSQVRAGASSVASALSNALTIPALIVFGVISDRHTVFSAAFVVIILCALLFLAIFNKPHISEK